MSAEDKETLQILSTDIKQLSKTFMAFNLMFYTFLGASFRNYLKSLNDFKLSNIKREGIRKVLTSRALKFFGIELVLNNERSKKIKKKITKKAIKKIVKKLLKVILLPGLILLVSVQFLMNFEKKEEKNVKNNYRC